MKIEQQSFWKKNYLKEIDTRAKLLESWRKIAETFEYIFNIVWYFPNCCIYDLVIIWCCNYDCVKCDVRPQFHPLWSFPLPILQGPNMSAKKKHAKISLNMWELTVTYFFSNHHINCITTMSTNNYKKGIHSWPKFLLYSSFVNLHTLVRKYYLNYTIIYPIIFVSPPL